MAELSLEEGEQMVISSHGQLQELKFFSQFKTGETFLTDRRFIFIGRLQIRGLGHLIAVAMGRGRKYFEIPVSAVLEVKKRRLEGCIEIVYERGSKKKKVLLKPEKIRYLGPLLGLGLGIVGEELGRKVGDSVSDRVGEFIGRKIGGKIGEETGGVTGKAMGNFEAQSLIDAWLKAFQYSMQTEQTSVTIPEKAVTPKDRIQKPSPLKRSHRMKKVSLGEILEEELGENFGDFDIPIDQIVYLKQLIDKFEDARGYIEIEVCSQELRRYLRQLKELQNF
jgi:hypothetical protein